MAKKTMKTAKAGSRKVARKSAARRAVAKRAAAKPTAASGGSGLRSAAPSFTVNDLDKSMAWYRDVLGFAVKQRWENEGRLVGAEMTAGGVTFNLGQDDWKMGRDRQKGQGVRMYVMTDPQIDRVADRIKARGGTLAQEPKDDWGMRAFSLEDPDGYKITFYTPLKKR